MPPGSHRLGRSDPHRHLRSPSLESRFPASGHLHASGPGARYGSDSQTQAYVQRSNKMYMYLTVSLGTSSCYFFFSFSPPPPPAIPDKRLTFTSVSVSSLIRTRQILVRRSDFFFLFFFLFFYFSLGLVSSMSDPTFIQSIYPLHPSRFSSELPD